MGKDEVMYDLELFALHLRQFKNTYCVTLSQANAVEALEGTVNEMIDDMLS